MASTDFVDPYLDPDTGLLRNLVGARTDDDLVAAEGALVFARAVQLLDQPPRPTGDLTELKAIHGHLFQDLFDWAGDLRTVDIRKNSADAEFFLPVSLIERASGFVAEQLRDDNYLQGMARDQFIERLADHYDEPTTSIRSGRATAARNAIFWSRVARDAGWQLDWRPVQGATNDEACRIAQVTRISILCARCSISWWLKPRMPSNAMALGNATSTDVSASESSLIRPDCLGRQGIRSGTTYGPETVGSRRHQSGSLRSGSEGESLTTPSESVASGTRP